MAADRLTLAHLSVVPQRLNQPVFGLLEIEHEWISVIEFGGHWFACCACGFVSSGYLSEAEARRSRCEVQDSLLRSAELLGHILASSDERRSVLRHE
jgi:hypothetical protein